LLAKYCKVRAIHKLLAEVLKEFREEKSGQLVIAPSSEEACTGRMERFNLFLRSGK